MLQGWAPRWGSVARLVQSRLQWGVHQWVLALLSHSITFIFFDAVSGSTRNIFLLFYFIFPFGTGNSHNITHGEFHIVVPFKGRTKEKWVPHGGFNAKMTLYIWICFNIKLKLKLWDPLWWIGYVRLWSSDLPPLLTKKMVAELVEDL